MSFVVATTLAFYRRHRGGILPLVSEPNFPGPERITERAFTILEIPPVDSMETAVKIAIVAKPNEALKR
jgi:hypothetical protein